MSDRTGVLAWHFVSDTLRDDTFVPSDGEVLRHPGPLVLCRSGLHASVRAIDALFYAPGPIACRVVCRGIGERRKYKFVCAERTILWRVDATLVLPEFARRCALDVADLWPMPPVVRHYLETGGETFRGKSVYDSITGWGPDRCRDLDRRGLAAVSAAIACGIDKHSGRFRNPLTRAKDSASSAARAAVGEGGFSGEAAAWEAVAAAHNERLAKLLIEAAHGCMR